MLTMCRPVVACLVTVLIVCFAAGYAAEAQQGPHRGPEREFRPGRPPVPPHEIDRFHQFARRYHGTDVSQEDLAKMIELVRAWRMMKEVGLDEEQSLRLLKLGQEMKQEAAKLKERREKAGRELKGLLDDPEAKDEAIIEKLEALKGFEEAYIVLRREYEAKMVEGLTVRQRAKLELFKSRFEKDMRRLIHRVGEGRGRRPRGFMRGPLGRGWRRHLQPPPPGRPGSPMPHPPLPEGEHPQ